MDENIVQSAFYQSKCTNSFQGIILALFLFQEPEHKYKLKIGSLSLSLSLSLSGQYG